MRRIFGLRVVLIALSCDLGFSAGYCDASGVGPGQSVEADAARAYTVLEQLWKETQGKSYYARTGVPLELAPYAPDRALQLSAQGAKPDLAGVISALALANPARAAEWAPAQIDRIQEAAGFIYAASLLGISIADHHPDAAQQLYVKIADRRKTAANAALPGAPPGFLEVGMAALAGKLKRPEAELLLQAAIQVAKSAKTEAGQPPAEELLGFYAEYLAKGSSALAEKAAADLPPERWGRALARAIPEIARYDVASAQRLLKELPNASGPTGGQSYGLASKAVVEALGRTDPAAALELARGVQSPEHRPMALALAARAQHGETAGKTYREALEAVAASGNRLALAAQITALAYEQDRAVGETLFGELKRRVDAEKPAGMDLMAYAFYSARRDREESRKSLEAAWTQWQQAPEEANHGWAAVRIALAMAAVDIDRALEMAASVPETPGWEARRKIAQYLLAPDAVRHTLPFDRWNASDTWMPGTPSGW